MTRYLFKKKTYKFKFNANSITDYDVDCILYMYVNLDYIEDLKNRRLQIYK